MEITILAKLRNARYVSLNFQVYAQVSGKKWLWEIVDMQ